LRYQLNTANPILAVIDRNSESVVGSEIRMALRYGRNGGVGNRAEDGILPSPNSRKTKQASFQTKNLFARIQISNKTMLASRSRDGAFVSLLEAELEDAQNDAKDSMARQCFGDGTGKIAQCTAQSSVTTLTVSSVQYLVEGMFIDIMDNSNNVKVTQREITNVDDINNQITISGAAVTTLATDYI
ncbi:TPA: phage major capsid protein, partial [Listeria monocytogenes]|nr:phage major capsid protein [Listeria monocytogenes]